MKKLLAVILILLCSSLAFAKEITEKYTTGSWIRYTFQSFVGMKKQTLTGKYYTEYPQRIYSILPFNDGYVLKLSFSNAEYSYPVLELFVKPGMVFETRNSECTSIKIVSVEPNEVELCFNTPD